MDLPQIVLLVAIVLVATILIIVGVQIIFILKDAKAIMRKLDLILSDLEFMSRHLTSSTLTVGHLVDSVKSGIELANVATKLLSAVTTKKKV